MKEKQFDFIIEQALLEKIASAQGKLNLAQDELEESRAAYEWWKSGAGRQSVDVKADSEAPVSEQLSPAAPEDYKSEWTWEQKIVYLMNKDARPMSTTEMVNIIFSYEPWRGRDKIVASVSAVLSQKSKDGGKFEKSMDARGGNLYCLRKTNTIALVS